MRVPLLPDRNRVKNEAPLNGQRGDLPKISTRLDECMGRMVASTTRPPFVEQGSHIGTGRLR